MGWFSDDVREDLRERAEMTPLILRGVAKAVTGQDCSDECDRLTEISAQRRARRDDQDRDR